MVPWLQLEPVSARPWRITRGDTQSGDADPMTWEAVTAIASLSSAIVVCVAAVAAVIQIRHLRTGNQLEAFLRIYDVFNSPDMIAARGYCLDELPEVLANESSRAAFIAGPVEPRLLLVGNFENEVGALVVDGFLEERLVWPLVPVAARLWAIAEPVAQHCGASATIRYGRILNISPRYSNVSRSIDTSIVSRPGSAIASARVEPYRTTARRSATCARSASAAYSS